MTSKLPAEEDGDPYPTKSKPPEIPDLETPDVREDGGEEGTLQYDPEKKIWFTKHH